MKNFLEINEFQSMYLTNHFEPAQNTLYFEVQESKISETSENINLGSGTISNMHRVSLNDSGNKFKIYFESYIAYQVVTESFLNYNDWDEFKGGKFNSFCIFKKSRYLDFILKETIADYIFPGELKHYGLYCQHHVVHIISASEPKIEKN